MNLDEFNAHMREHEHERDQYGHYSRPGMGYPQPLCDTCQSDLNPRELDNEQTTCMACLYDQDQENRHEANQP